MASSSSSLCQTTYDVFVSFRGTDVRHGFFSHLTKELRGKQIHVYTDERLESGDEISSALVTAIEESMISLVIFSQHYASSRWCLEELVKIMDCRKHNGRIVIPVFYNIDPTDARYQKGTYGDAFAKHEQKYDMGKLRSWRSALNEAANLSGHHYQSNFKNESELNTVIVQDVLEKLKLLVDSSLEEPTRLVGFQKHFSCVESLLEFESQNVKIIGIWGMGGIGKTTLAQAVFDKFSSQFQSSCFLENVREESEKINGLSHLLQKLYCQLLEEENLNLYDTNTNTKHFIKRRLARMKVLIVLDDVTTVDQLEKLVGKGIQLGSGSRIIITSRDRHVLDCKGIHVHEIGELSEEESLTLFSLYAFDEREPKIGYEKLSKSVIMYVKGIPLGLKVLGSHFQGRNEKEWEDALKELQKYPDKEIQKVLRVSYNGLTKSQQDLFLDIAFFFKGHLKDDVIAVLDACGFFPIIGIKVLQEKALITISNDNRVQMHDFLQEMGEQVVREESYNHPERRSRLKDTDELYELFWKNNGTDKIEGIVFDVSRIKNVCLSKDTFIKMPKLRILKMYSGPWCERSNIDVSSDIESVPDELKYFHWDEYPLESLPPTFNTQKLVEFRMERSRVSKLWDEVKELGNLKILNLRGSKHLIELPDFSEAINLERLLLSDCESLLRVHQSIYSLPKPVCLEVDRCHGLSNVVMTKLCCFKSLKELSLKGCKQVNKMVLQMVFDVSRCLELLDLDSCNNLLELPATIKHLPKLQNMKLNACIKLRSIPELPPALKRMHAQYCKELKTIAVPSRNSMAEGKGEPWDLDFSFKDSVNLDEGIAMKFNSLSLMKAIYRDSSGNEHSACYPATTIPSWFTYKETAGYPFIVELVPPSDSDQLLGFVLCGILPQLASGCRICFFFFFEDGDCYWRGYSNRMFDLCDSNKDLAFMWFVPHNKILPKTDEGRMFDEMGCYFICEAFGEAVEGAACGVCPIYASKLDNIVAQILESNTSDHDDNDDDDDENHKPDEIQTQPHFQININRINPTPFDKQNGRKGLQLFG